MASTNKTTTLDLSQFVGTDKPDWLTDYNDDMEKIDTWATTTDSDVSNANNKATQAVNTANAATTAANNAVTVANSIVNGWEGITPTNINTKITGMTRTIRGNVPAGILFVSAYFYKGDGDFSLAANEALFTIPAKFKSVSTTLYGAITLKDNSDNYTISNLVIDASGNVSLWSGFNTITGIKEMIINSIAVIPV